MTVDEIEWAEYGGDHWSIDGWYHNVYKPEELLSSANKHKVIGKPHEEWADYIIVVPEKLFRKELFENIIEWIKTEAKGEILVKSGWAWSIDSQFAPSQFARLRYYFSDDRDRILFQVFFG